MSKPEWGTKRTCQSCNTRFYDLRKEPIICPKCGSEYVKTAIESGRRGRRPKTKVNELNNNTNTTVEKMDGDETVNKELEDSMEFVEDIDTDNDAENVIEDTTDLGDDEDDVAIVIDAINEKEGQGS